MSYPRLDSQDPASIAVSSDVFLQCTYIITTYFIILCIFFNVEFASSSAVYIQLLYQTIGSIELHDYVFR